MLKTTSRIITRHALAAAVLALLTTFGGMETAKACTSLVYRDTAGGTYAGRTLELPMELPYLVSYLPPGMEIASHVAGRDPLRFRTKFGILAITVPNGSVKDLKIVEGVNEKGLTFSLLAFAGAAGPADNADKTKAALAAIDLGAWTLGQFETAADVKSSLTKQTVVLSALRALGGARTPFHFVVHDRTGASIVIEFADGKQTIYDNPLGVMTNGPEFSWHLTNMDNYSFLTNVDKSTGKFGSLSVRQPDSGIATAGLPSSNTSVGRFVRAAYYAEYAEKVAPPAAMSTLAHIMNNFDRPKNITIDARGSGGLEVEGASPQSAANYTTEYTSWTSLTDLNNRLLLIRTYDGTNYVKFDLTRLAALKEVRLIPLADVGQLSVLDATDQLIAAQAP